MTDTPEVKMAVLTNEVQGLREQQKSHADETRTTLSNISTTLVGVNNWMQQNTNLPKEHEELWTHHQRQKGFINASRIIMGTLGGMVAFAIERLIEMFHK